MSFLKTLNYDLKSVILIYDNLECLLTKKLSRKLLILLFQFVAPNFCFLFIHWLVKMSNRWNVLIFLQSYIKILEMCKKNLISPTANTFKAQFTAEIFPSKQL